MTDAALADRLKATLRGLPGPVALVTTVDPVGAAPQGMLASAVIPVSMDPPSMLVAINRSASMHPTLAAAGRFCINVLGTSQAGVLALFSKAELRAQRFESDQWRYDAGLPWLPAACSSIFCRTASSSHFGTHELFIGEVTEVVRGSGDIADPMGWINGSPARLGPIG